MLQERLNYVYILSIVNDITLSYEQAIKKYTATNVGGGKGYNRSVSGS
jgi:hypothetical protein